MMQQLLFAGATCFALMGAETAVVTTSTTSDGITVTLVDDPRGVNSADRVWEMWGSDSDPLFDWGLHVNLAAETYGFKESSTSSVTVSLFGSRAKSSNAVTSPDAFLGISIGEHYVTYAFDLDTIGDVSSSANEPIGGVWSYPYCSTGVMATGDVSTLFSESNLDSSTGLNYYQQGREALCGGDTVNCELLTSTNSDNQAPWVVKLLSDDVAKTLQISFWTPTYESEPPLTCTWDVSEISVLQQDIDVYVRPQFGEEQGIIIGAVDVDASNETTASTAVPDTTASTAAGLCDAASIASFDWDDLMTAGTKKPEVVSFAMDVNDTDLSLNIDVSLTFEGRSSADIDGAVYGTTYVLDFEDFDAHQDSISQPGTCQNRNTGDFTGGFDSYWDYSLNPDDVGSAAYLAYPPPGDFWSVEMADAQCGVVQYKGKFTWNELLGCQSYDLGDGVYVSTGSSDDDEKLTLEGTFYINVVSPMSANMDLGYYHVYQLLSQPFLISVNKNLQVLGATGINLFTVSVIAVYKETGASLFKLIVLTESAEYLQLSRTGLGAGLAAFESSSVENSQPQITAFSVADAAENEGCLNNKDYICSQLWQIEAPGDCREDNDQFIDFSGDYTLQFTPVCRSAAELTAAGAANGTALHDYCDGWLAAHSSGESSIAAGVGLVATLQWRDEECDPILFEVQFQAEMLFYTDDAFTSEAGSTLYQVGEDRIYVEVDTTWPTAAFDVFDTTLLNVWICTFDPLSPPRMPIEPGSLSGGCFSAGPDPDPAIDGAVAGQEFGVGNMYAYHIYDAQSTVTVPDEIAFSLVGHPSDPAEMEKLRFSFVVPEQVARDTLYIHAQIEVSLTGGGGRRRQLLQGPAAIGWGRAMANQMSHFLGNIGVSTDERPAPPQVPVNKPAPQPWNQIPSGGENGAYVLSLRSPWIMAIAGLLAVILTCNVAFWCCVRGCGGGRRGRVLFADYEKVKVNESEFDESEANVLNVVSE